ncbi:hypothetical protein KGF54_002525 [Candida jiufengensis]|uniref:uncharacterized protein n=1 Tax=Candida jiufengensis TaxID=497108 RepID=UPI0022240FB5|nr:uncharacterized protein KGF54_002525 [Candida jiufengensis]KAI5953154.1 hypothetical protein KGF54_002525 [Candida jiufengensis]
MLRFGIVKESKNIFTNSRVPSNLIFTFSFHRNLSNSTISPNSSNSSNSSSSSNSPNLSNTQLIKSPIIDKNSIYVISIPITTKRSFIYCNHRPDLLSKSQASKIPLYIKLETKVINLATKGWNKLINSKSKINIKIVEFIQKLLSTIPYQENCLRSFPNKEAMIREINEESLHLIKPIEKKEPENDHQKGEKDTIILQSEITNLKIPNNQLKPIPLYHAKHQLPTTILNELYDFRVDNKEEHKKNAWLCGIAIPLCLPFALIPIVPNVPGFYFTYRLYCNYKALLGIKHLDYLLETDIPQDDYYPTDEKTVEKTTHLKFNAVKEIDQIYASYNTDLQSNQININNGDDELLLITPEIINDLVDTFDLDIKDELSKALMQERKRLNRDVKVDDQVN